MAYWCLCYLLLVFSLVHSGTSSPVIKPSVYRNDADTGNWTKDFFATWSSDPEDIRAPSEDVTKEPPIEEAVTTEAATTETSIISHQNEESIDYLRWIQSEDEREFRSTHAKYIDRYRNTIVDPCENFYEYACGNWHIIHADYKQTCDFSADYFLKQEISDLLKGFITSDVQAEDPSYVLKLKDFYASCMDMDTLTERGMKPLVKFLADLGSWPMLDPDWSSENFDWVSMTAKAARFGIDLILEHAVIADKVNGDPARRFQLHFGCEHFFPLDSFKTGLGFYKEFLLNHTQDFGISEEYIDGLLADLPVLYGKLADIPCSMDNIEVVDLKTLREKVPGIDWQEYFSTLLGRIMSPREVIVVHGMDFLVTLSQVIADSNPKVLADLIASNIIAQYAAHTDAYQRADRNGMCIRQVKTYMASVLSNLFAKNYFNTNKQNEVLDIIEDLKAVLRNSVTNNYWLEKQSRLDAFLILDKITANVGYTDLYTDDDLEKMYSTLDIEPRRYFENIAQLQKMSIDSRLDLLGQNVDDTMETHYINAMMQKLSGKFSLIVPAGRLQPPFYHEFAPRFVNYGSVGQVLGHDMLRPLLSTYEESNESTKTWYVEEDQQEYNERTACYSSLIYRNETEKENDEYLPWKIAAFEALKIAAGAFNQWVQNHPDVAETDIKDYAMLDLTPAQLFYVVFAQNQCSGSKSENGTTEASQERLFFVNGIVSNTDDFAEAFACQAGSVMNPPRKCSLIV